MELPHWDLARFFEIRGLGDVLILILMELPHWGLQGGKKVNPLRCLNPYSNGITSLGLPIP